MASLPCSAVVFDLDGTLLDTLADIADSANEVLTGLGWPTHSHASYRRFIGDGVVALFGRAVPASENTSDAVARCVADFRTVYGRRWNIHSRPYGGIAALLDALAARELRMAVLSNKPHEFTIRCVGAFFRPNTFEIVFGQRAGVLRKPDPAGANEISQRFALPADRILYLGDSATDMQTARAAGMVPVGALWGYRSRDELLESGAAIVLEQPLDLLDALGPRALEVV